MRSQIEILKAEAIMSLHGMAAMKENDQKTAEESARVMDVLAWARGEDNDFGTMISASNDFVKDALGQILKTAADNGKLPDLPKMDAEGKARGANGSYWADRPKAEEKQEQKGLEIVIGPMREV